MFDAGWLDQDSPEEVAQHPLATTLGTVNRYNTKVLGPALSNTFLDLPSASAILDRFLQSASIMKITGRSYRLKNAEKNSKGTKAPTGSRAEKTK
jgi:hypothetical protein